MTVSLQQLRWAHTSKGKKALGKKGVREFEISARGKKLPLYAKPKKNISKKSRLAARKKG